MLYMFLHSSSARQTDNLSPKLREIIVKTSFGSTNALRSSLCEKTLALRFGDSAVYKAVHCNIVVFVPR